jgi:hypothetical protein
LPAPEIERTVAAAASTMLGDEAAIADAALALGLAEHQLPSLFSLAAAWMNRLQSEVEVGPALNALVDRVDLINTGIRVSLKLPSSITEEQHGANSTALTITRVFPMQIRRRGFEMRLVLQGSRAPAPLADLALIKAIARGRQWADDLLSDRVESVAAFARREGVLPNYVRRITRLAFLSPRIVEAIVTSTAGAYCEGSDRTDRTAAPLERAGTDARNQLISACRLSHRFGRLNSIPLPPKRSLRIRQQTFSPWIAHHLPESGFLRDHTFVNEAAGAGFSVIWTEYRQR